SNKARLYISVVVIMMAGFVGIIGKLFYEMYIDHLAGNLSKKWLGVGIIVGFYAFFWIGFLVKGVQAMLKATRTVTIDKNAISFGTDEVSYSEIKHISTFDVGRIAYEHFYGVLIYLNDGSTKLIAGRFFKDAPLLFEIFDKLNYSQRTHTDSPEGGPAQHHKDEGEERFNYNILLSFDNIAALIFLLFMFFVFLDFIFRKEHPTEFTLAIAGTIVLFYYLNIRLSYYFIVDDHNLEIKNRFLPGFSKIYR